TLERFPYRFRDKSIEIGQVELFLKLKDGLTNSGGELVTVSLTSPDSTEVTAPFQSTASFLNGMPHAVMDLSAGLGTWVLAAQKDDIEQLATTLAKPDPFEDIIVVCHYSAT